MCTRISAEIEALNVRRNPGATAEIEENVVLRPGHFLLDRVVQSVACLPDRHEAADDVASAAGVVPGADGDPSRTGGGAVASPNPNAPESRIHDLEAAAEMVVFIKAQILQQGRLAILAQTYPAQQTFASQPK